MIRQGLVEILVYGHPRERRFNYPTPTKYGSEGIVVTKLLEEL